MLEKLRLTEIFFSLQGESSRAGFPTVFIRLTGCPLRCQYCDTAYAFKGGKSFAIAQIIKQVQGFAASYVCVTGGEPLSQPNSVILLKALCDLGFKVSLETSGALDVSPVDPRVKKILDIKTPDSGEVDKNFWSNISVLTDHDEIKFVVCSKNDFDWALSIIKQYDLSYEQILFSPSYQQVSSQELSAWLLESKVPARFQIQLHKTIWGDEPGN